jgi:hypothetical protein
VTAEFERATGVGGKFHGMADLMGQTMGGRLSTAMDGVNEMFLNLYNIISPLVLPILIGVIWAIDGINAGFGWMIDLFNQGNEVMILVTSLLGGLAIALAAAAIQAGILFVWTQLVTFATWLWTAAMNANPLFWVVLAIGAVVSAVMICWDKFEGFRKFIFTLWESVKTVFGNIGTFIKGIFAPIGEIIEAFHKGDWGGVAKAGAKLMFNLSPVGMIANGMDFAKNGGFTNGLDEAKARGDARGAKSWKDSSDKKSAQDKMEAAANGGKPKDANLMDKVTGGKEGGGGGSGKATTINITLGSLVQEIKIMGNDLKQMEKDIEDVVINALARTLTVAQSQMGAQ